jgi:hypothetical protein
MIGDEMRWNGKKFGGSETMVLVDIFAIDGI